MAETTKCAHPACSCVVTKDGRYGKYCSEYCKEMAAISELICRCKHPECR
jgi:hypothetical protein